MLVRCSHLALTAVVLLVACAAPSRRARSLPPPSTGSLLAIGGGLDNDSRAIYERFVALASRNGPPAIVIATAATGEEDVEATDKTQALAIWCPDAAVTVVRRATSTADTVAAFDAATGVIFTGGDQQRITDRYRPQDEDTPEWEALRRVLERGGVIAGASAGDAMQGDVMLLGGGSASALGYGSDAQGPRHGPGMRLQPWFVTDSHFFERDRLGRLVAVLEDSGRRFGIGVGEDACVEVDFATRELVGVTDSESLLVDVGGLRRDGAVRAGVVARLVRRGDRIAIDQMLGTPLPSPPAAPAGAPIDIPVVEPGQNRQLASWRLIARAANGRGVTRLQLAGWQVRAWGTGGGEVAVAIAPANQ